MIPLFRKIRQRLLAGGRFGRYMVYAFGEIVLVVIGILLALQVNNWSEDAKLEQRQTVILSDLRSDLQKTMENLSGGKGLNEVTLENYRHLMKAIDNDAPYSAAIDSAIRFLPIFHVPMFTRTAYESIKSQGLDLLTNKSLKTQISQLYEFEYLYLTEDQGKLEWSIHDGNKQVYMNRYLRWVDSDDLMVHPVDFEQIKSDPGFVNFLSELIVVRNAGIGFYQRMIDKTAAVIAAIDDELIRLKE